MTLSDERPSSFFRIARGHHPESGGRFQVANELRAPVATPDDSHTYHDQKPPSPNSTTRTVRASVRRYSVVERFQIQHRSISTISSKSTRLRPITCHRPVIPGLTERRER